MEIAFVMKNLKSYKQRQAEILANELLGKSTIGWCYYFRPKIKKNTGFIEPSYGSMCRWFISMKPELKRQCGNCKHYEIQKS